MKYGKTRGYDYLQLRNFTVKPQQGKSWRTNLFKSLLDFVPFPCLSVLLSGSLGTRRTGEGVFLRQQVEKKHAVIRIKLESGEHVREPRTFSLLIVFKFLTQILGFVAVHNETGFN